MLEADSIEHAVELLSKHPSLRYGISTEIRPIDEEALCTQQDAVAQVCETGAASPGAKPDAFKFALLGFGCRSIWESVPERERNAMLENCIAFDNERRKNGQWLNGIRLQTTDTAKTMRPKNGKVIVTDGPFAETKEQLGGLVVNAFENMQQAIEVISNHPALRFGIVMEIRPIAEEMTARWEAQVEHFQKV